MRTYCIAHGIPLSALWRLKWEGDSKKRDIQLIRFCCAAENNTS